MKGVSKFLVLALGLTATGALRADEAKLRALLGDHLNVCQFDSWQAPDEVVAARTAAVHSPVFGAQAVPGWALEELAASMVAFPEKALGWKSPQFCCLRADQTTINRGFITWCEGMRLMLYLCAKQGVDPVIFLPVSWGPNDMFVPSACDHLAAWLSMVRRHFIDLGVPSVLIEHEWPSIGKFARGRGRWVEILRK